MRLFSRLLALIVLTALLTGSCAALAEEALFADAQWNYDSQKEYVLAAQKLLQQIGLLEGKADGIYGPKTAAALLAFQQMYDLEPTGHLDMATVDKMMALTEAAASVRQVQQRLIDLGYLEGSADGRWGPKSVEAMKIFQTFHGLEATGAYDDWTTQVLYSDDAHALPAPITSGSDTQAVTRLQQRLIRYGFLDDAADGSYGQRTAAAVAQFQQHLIAQGHTEGVTASGVATAITQYYLFSESYSTYLKDLTPGETSDEALRVERRLVRLGYMDLPASDTFDTYAQEALALFKSQNDLFSFGSVDKTTIDALFANNAPTAERCAPHDIALGQSGRAVQEAQRALISGGMMLGAADGTFGSATQEGIARAYLYLTAMGDSHAALFSEPNALSKAAQQALTDGLLGWRTDDYTNETEAERIQRRLYQLFYLPLSGVDGKFGSKTRSALRTFKAANGLEDSEAIDRTTLTKLFSQDAAVKPYPYRVEVSIARQVVEVYQLVDGAYEKAQTFKCSTGLNDTTPRGIYLNGYPMNRWHYFKKFDCWAQYSYEIIGDILFHSVLYSSNDERTLRTGSVSALGSPASHGCIRLQVEDAKWLFEHCKKGSVVIIIY